MSQELVQGLADADLVEAAKAGDQQAFADLYTRYFDPIYDFILRMTRNRDEAADLAQDTFIKAMNSLPGLQTGASFKSWIYTIARNTTLNRLERASRIRPLAVEDEDGEEVTFDVVDTDRFGSPEEAAEASALASLVWEAAQGLDAKQLTLLDLHLRQGLESAEIAEVMGVTKNNGYVMLNRLKKAVEEAIGAYIMLNDGRKYCERLDTALDRAGIASMTPEVRKLVEKHVAQCDQCTERKKKLVSPLAVFGAFAPVTAPAGLKEGILGEVMRRWPLPPDTGTGLGGASSAGDGGASVLPLAGGAGGAGAGVANGSRRGGFGGRGFNFAIGAGSLVAVLGALLFVPASPFALNNGSGDELPAAPIVVPPTETPTATITVEVPAGDGTPTPTASPSSTATPSASAPADSTATTTPSPTTAVATPTQSGAVVSTPTPSPTATASNTPTPRPTNTATPRPTSTPTRTPTTLACVPALGSNVPNVNAGSRTSAQFTLLNLGNCSADVIVTNQSGNPWLSVSPTTATLAPSGSRTVTITIVRDLVPAGGDTGTVLVVTQGAATQVTVSVDGPPTPTPTNTPTPTPVVDTQAPELRDPRACLVLGTTASVQVSVAATDNVGVTAVTVTDGTDSWALQLSSGTGQAGTWRATIPYTSANFYSYSAFDAAGNQQSLTGGTAQTC